MGDFLKQTRVKVDALSQRERLLITVTIIIVVLLVWHQFFQADINQEIKRLSSENEKLDFKINNNQIVLASIKKKLEFDINAQKKQQLQKLKAELEDVKDKLRLKTIELIDPEEMFHLMADLIYKESRLKLLSLKRREVRQAIQFEESKDEDFGIYRHVLEIRFSGKYHDILAYIKKIEDLDWQLIWDEVELAGNDYPSIDVKIVFSTLSTRKEWVGV